jgi:hypothetical protein
MKIQLYKYLIYIKEGYEPIKEEYPKPLVYSVPLKFLMDLVRTESLSCYNRYSPAEMEIGGVNFWSKFIISIYGENFNFYFYFKYVGENQNDF